MNQLAAPAPQRATLPVRRRQRSGLEGLLILAWLLAVGGAALAVVGVFLAGIDSVGVEAPLDVRLGGLTAVAGGVLLLAGLVVASYRSVVLRRELGEDRYRGPSILILLVMVFIIATMLSLPFLDVFQAVLEGDGAASEWQTLLLLISTSVTLLAVGITFVMLPRALPGVRWLPHPFERVWRPFLLGVMIGGPAWIGATLVSVLVNALLGALFGLHPDVELIQRLAPDLSPLTAILVIVLAAPIAEEPRRRRSPRGYRSRATRPGVSQRRGAAKSSAVEMPLKVAWIAITVTRLRVWW